MVGEERGLGRPIAGERLGDRPMPALALAHEQIVVDDLSGQGMAEGVPLGPAFDLDHQLGFDELAKVILERGVVDPASVAEHLEGELQPGHGCCRERGARVHRKPFASLADRLLHRSWDAQLGDLLPPPTLGCPIHVAGLDERPQQLFGEEWVALGTGVDRVAELLADLHIRCARGECRAHQLLAAHRLERGLRSTAGAGGERP